MKSYRFHLRPIFRGYNISRWCVLHNSIYKGDSTFVVKTRFEIDALIRPVLRIFQASDDPVSLFNRTNCYDGPVCKICYTLHKLPWNMKLVSAYQN